MDKSIVFGIIVVSVVILGLLHVTIGKDLGIHEWLGIQNIMPEVFAYPHNLDTVSNAMEMSNTNMLVGFVAVIFSVVIIYWISKKKS